MKSQFIPCPDTRIYAEELVANLDPPILHNFTWKLAGS